MHHIEKQIHITAVLALLCLVIFSFATKTLASASVTIFLTSGTTWIVPADWNNGNNTVEAIGGGGGGGANYGSGGGGGAYAKATNVSLSGTVSYSIGAGGIGGTSGSDNATAGGDTIFNTNFVTAKGGSRGRLNGYLSTPEGGQASASTPPGGAFSGGNGGNNNGSGGYGAGGGGGGAASKLGKGANGGVGITNIGTGGGGSGGGMAGDNGATGVGGNNDIGAGGGTAPGGNGSSGLYHSAGGGAGGGYWVYTQGGNGGNGEEWDSTHGSGGGGGGAGISNGTNNGGPGGNYGGGGGSGGYSVGMNGGAGAGGLIVITYTPVVPGLPDLITENLTGSGVFQTGQTLTFSGNVRNSGLGNAPASTTARFCIDNTTCIDTDTGQIGAPAVSALVAGTYSPTFSATWVATLGTHTIYFCANVFIPSRVVTESDETNNCSSAPFDVSPPSLPPDLVAQNLTGSGVFQTGQTLTFSGNVQNSGLGDALATSTVNFWVNNDSYRQPAVIFGTDSVDELAAGASSPMFSHTWVATDGIYTVFLCADVLDFESDYTNNCTSMTFGVSPPPPTATLVASPSSINRGESSTLTWSSSADAVSCTAAGGFSTGGATSTNPPGGVQVSPPTTLSYQISCVNSDSVVGYSNIAQVTVSNPAASIQATPTRVSIGGGTDISWTTSDVDQCYITRNNDPWLHLTLGNGLLPTGSTTAISITTQTVFAITCDAPPGLVPSATTTVNVRPVFQNH